MPSIYLSPSQEYNPYITGGTEEQYMNELADALEPYLLSNGIRFIRNKPEMTAASSIAASNAGEYDLHLALHSNAAPGAQAGTVRGSQAYYYPGSSRGERAAQHFAEQLKRIYPLPENVQAIPTTTIGEVRRTRAPAVLLEVAYHDNPEDAAWITANISEIARALAQALTQYFGLPFREAAVPRDGVVTLTSGYLNIRDNPSPQGTVIARAYNGAPLTIWGRAGDYAIVQFGTIVGFAKSEFISIFPEPAQEHKTR